MTPVWMPRHHWTKTRSFWNRSKAAILRDLYLAGGPEKEINALIKDVAKGDIETVKKHLVAGAEFRSLLPWRRR